MQSSHEGNRDNPGEISLRERGKVASLGTQMLWTQVVVMRLNRWKGTTGSACSGREQLKENMCLCHSLVTYTV